MKIAFLVLLACVLLSGCHSRKDIAKGSHNFANLNLVADGNSYVDAVQGGYTHFPALIGSTSPFSINGTTVRNFGVSAQTTLQMLSDQSSQVLSQYISGRLNVLLVVEGGNDIYFHGSVDSAVARMKRYCNNARVKGFKVILSTTIPREQKVTSFGDDQTTFNSKLAKFNSAIEADDSFYDALIRPDRESIFATYTSGGYDADHVHPNQAGQQKLADLFMAKILALK